jgi:hypothetical protein
MYVTIVHHYLMYNGLFWCNLNYFLPAISLLKSFTNFGLATVRLLPEDLRSQRNENFTVDNWLIIKQTGRHAASRVL